MFFSSVKNRTKLEEELVEDTFTLIILGIYLARFCYTTENKVSSMLLLLFR